MTIAGIHWLRPLWLVALLPWLAGALWHWRHRRLPDGWEQAVDPALQAYVLEGKRKSGAKQALLLWLGWLLCIVLLAGPVWQQQEVPVFDARQAQVVLFDLSVSMQLDDVPPSRLVRARFKLRDLLARAADLQVALVAFSERPYVISPLTDDAATVQAFVPSLTPAIMPISGSRLDLAIDRGTELLAQAGVPRGQLVVLTDADATEADVAAARRAYSAGHRVSILAVGTRAGAPLRNAEGRTYVDGQGQEIVPGLRLDALRAVGDAGGGYFGRLASDSSDLAALQRVQARLGQAESSAESGATEPYWLERGPWALPVLALLALSLFRRGIL